MGLTGWFVRTLEEADGTPLTRRAAAEHVKRFYPQGEPVEDGMDLHEVDEVEELEEREDIVVEDSGDRGEVEEEREKAVERVFQKRKKKRGKGKGLASTEVQPSREGEEERSSQDVSRTQLRRSNRKK